MLRSKSVLFHFMDQLNKKIIRLNNRVNRIIFLLGVVVPLVGYSESGGIPLTDANFQTAINLWFDNQTDANATYGHISDRNVSAVTDMSNAFENKATFMKISVDGM